MAARVGAQGEAIGVGAAFLVDGFAYALVAVAAAVQLVRNCCRYRPWTVQKMIHLLMFFATLIRAVFLVLVGYDWCGVLTGEIDVSKCSTTERDLFYILDQLPILAFFATYALLMQFWAEVYYNAVDQIVVLSSFVKPMVKVLIAVMLLVQGLFWVLYASAWQSERSFFTKSQAILNMQMFLIVTAGFIYYGRKAYVELRSVPVELGIRSKKLKELALMTSICTSCFMTRCGLEMFLSTEKHQLHDSSTWFIVFVYYALLEIFPSISILYFNRRLPLRRRRQLGGARARNGRRSLFFSKGIDHDAQPDRSLRASLLHSEN
uniref:THH1/TOM1/TOM3 domain-containing protein n=1 Tax=Globisporangium ultimum (strain ATCC 200006 / CBS 805.95 / DAOM BR144) TaxID=431595 RepID=K3WPV5_GLOUD